MITGKGAVISPKEESSTLSNCSSEGDAIDYCVEGVYKYKGGKFNAFKLSLQSEMQVITGHRMVKSPKRGSSMLSNLFQISVELKNNLISIKVAYDLS